MKSVLKAVLILFGLAFAQSASAVLILIQWDAGATYPANTTYELQVNSTSVTGITTTSYDWAEDLVSGTSITVRVRAVPLSGYPSSWLTVVGTVPYVTPTAPTGYKLLRLDNFEAIARSKE